MPQASEELRQKIKDLLTEDEREECVGACLTRLEAAGIDTTAHGYGTLSASPSVGRALTDAHWDMIDYLVFEWDFAWRGIIE